VASIDIDTEISLTRFRDRIALLGSAAPHGSRTSIEE